MLGVLAVLVVVFVLAARWSPVLAGHPALLWTLVVVGLVGVAAAASALVVPTDGPPAPQPSVARRRWRLAGRIVATVAVVALLSTLVWLRPLGATARGLAALGDGNGVEVVENRTRIELRPTGALAPTGVVFYPGAKVDARAYSAILRPLAEAGHLVVIVKLPYGIAFADPNAAGSVIAAEDGVDRWVIAGHSLGGTVAARFASADRNTVVGLLLWASYPAGSLRDRTGLTVLSVSGTEDGLATPDDIEASRADLPADARFVAVQGAVHADFGDYGEQSGDGTRTIPHEEAQRQIAAASLELLAALDA